MRSLTVGDVGGCMGLQLLSGECCLVVCTLIEMAPLARAKRTRGLPLGLFPVAGNPKAVMAPTGADESGDEPGTRCVGCDRGMITYGATDSGGDAEIVDEKRDIDGAALCGYE